MRNNMITKKLIKFALLFFLIGLTACDNKLNPGFDPDDYEPIVPPEPVRTMDAMASGDVDIPYDWKRDPYPYPVEAVGMTFDGLHPSDEGNEAIAKLLAEKLQEILEQLS